jgi:uncharacterized protein (DUF3084 family)
VNDLRLLSEEFGFAALRSQVSKFQEGVSVVHEKARRCIAQVEEQNLQQDRTLDVLQREVVELQTACSDLAMKTRDLRKSNREQKQENRDASSRLSEENRSLREELAARNSGNSRSAGRCAG